MGQDGERMRYTLTQDTRYNNRMYPNRYRFYMPYDAISQEGTPENKVYALLQEETGSNGDAIEKLLTNATSERFTVVRDGLPGSVYGLVVEVKVDGDKMYPGDVAHALALTRDNLLHENCPVQFDIGGPFTFFGRPGSNVLPTGIVPEKFEPEAWLADGANPIRFEIVQRKQKAKCIAGFRLPDDLTRKYSPEFLWQQLAAPVNVYAKQNEMFNIVPVVETNPLHPAYYLAAEIPVSLNPEGLHEAGCAILSELHKVAEQKGWHRLDTGTLPELPPPTPARRR